MLGSALVASPDQQFHSSSGRAHQRPLAAAVVCLDHRFDALRFERGTRKLRFMSVGINSRDCQIALYFFAHFTHSRSATAAAQLSCRATALSMLSFGTAPTICSATCPFLKISSVGIPRTLYFPGVFMFSSTFIFTTFNFPARSAAIASTVGESALHGPHHVAQKSTITGCVLLA